MRVPATLPERLLAGAGKLFRLIVLPLTISLASTNRAGAAEFAFSVSPSGERVLSVSGPITTIDGALFLNEVNRHRPQVVAVTGAGGDMLSAARIGVIIHERQIATHAVGECRSACAFIWIAGSQLRAAAGAEILSHLPVAIKGAHEGEPHPHGYALFGWYLGKLNLSVEVMDAFLAAATAEGTVANQYFDMLAFAQYWNAPVKIVTDSAVPVLAGAPR